MKTTFATILVAAAAATPGSYAFTSSTQLRNAAATSLRESTASAAETMMDSSKTAPSSPETMDYSNEVGCMAPLGVWDPLGFLNLGGQERFNLLRKAELKHGRVSMLAVVGYLTTASGVRISGCEDIPAGLAGAAQANWAGVFLTCSLLEIACYDYSQDENLYGKDIPKAEFEGDYRNGLFDPGWDRFDDKTKMEKRNKELNNGRAAMMGIAGLVQHEKLGNLDEILPWGVNLDAPGGSTIVASAANTVVTAAAEVASNAADLV